MTKFAVVDLETTGQNPTKGDQIIEVGIVVVADGIVKQQYGTYVKPNQEIPLFISHLTGITDDQVTTAPSFSEIAPDIIELCSDAYFVAHHVQFDLGFLNEALMDAGFSPINEKVIDTVEFARIMAPRATGYKLSQLAEYFGIQHQRPHRALSDAYVTAEVLLKLLDKARKLPEETLEKLLNLEAKLNSDFYTLFRKWVENKRYVLEEENHHIEVYRGLALKKQKKPGREEHEWNPSFGEFLDEVFDSDGKLKEAMDQYESRPGQKEMAEMLFDSFQREKHALIEAETGTGKTLAYLLPSLFMALQNDERVVISTYTTHLQAQLLEQEIPLLEKIIPVSFDALIVKGKSHYLSLKKFEQELEKSPWDDNYDVILTKALLLVWITETDTGDVDELHLPSSGQIFWRRISAEAERTLDPKSPWFSRTYYQRIRRRAQKAHLIITNHALLCTDIVHDYEFLPEYQYAVIDEGHHLERTASRHFGMHVDYVSIQYLLNELEEILEDSDSIQLITESKEHADYLFRYFFDLVQQQRKQTSYNDIGRIQSLFQRTELKEDTFNYLKDLASRFVFSLKDILVKLDKQKQVSHEAYNDEEKEDEVKRKMEQIETLIMNLNLFLYDDETSMVKWIEIEAKGARNAVYLYCEPIDVGSLLKEKFYEEKTSVVLTSATLTIKNSFNYILERNGLNRNDVVTKKFPSPFSYKEQVQLLIPNDLPQINKDKEEDFLSAISYNIYELAKITNGRMLVLFTSYQMLKKTHELLKGFFDQDDFMIISQGISSGSRSRLQKNFQSFDKAILLGTSSFWEGIDIPGEDLSSVVIVRLPFEPPNHPVYSARAEALKEEGENPFMKLALPNAVIRFKQGFGRLIRSSKDRGIVFVCDGRLMKAKYGKYFIESIPQASFLYNDAQTLLDHAREWFS
ncbi:ATP-dependent DNA helicase DinG [Salinibacillus kushneri]|uniref:3'-5' exonuclease DinG n=1 Tax=Salinibacillus kushneri TaxID=237682 RepID=A0A1I0I2G0_9BACI|nr:ATP-dependent DNA helicase DinG [Salinibacillus kushneri]SET90819.1 ATP-dependent DNA helicase DinG [Salinibacillus kushneri]